MRTSRLGAGVRRPGRADQTARTVKRPRRQLAGEQPVALIRAGQPQRLGLFAREAEAPIIGCVADQQHGRDACAAVQPPSRGASARRRSPGALAFVHRQRPEQHRRPAGAGADVPQADRADDVAIVFGDERKPGRRLAAFAQPLGGFLEARRPPHAVEQVLARIDIERGISVRIVTMAHSFLACASGGGVLFEQD